MKENFDFENGIPETPKRKSYADLDLGLDFDLSFLDDIDESVLPEEDRTPQQPVRKPVPAKKPAPKADGTTPVRKAAPVSREDTPVKKPAPRKPVAPADGKVPAKKPAPRPVAEGAAPVKKPAAKKSAPVSREPVKTKKQKKGPRLGGVIFYTLYFMFILVFFVATYIGLQWLHGWLSDYQLAQPTVKAEQVFQEVFTDPDWGALYTSAGAKDSPYEGKEAYVNYMERKVGDSKLTYMETSAGLSGNKKYVVHLGDEKVASFTLVDRNETGSVSLENLENITDIPDWQLGAVEVFFEREDTYYVVKLDGYTAYVNGVPLDESATIQRATTVAESYLPEGTTGFSMDTQQVSGLMELPTVTVTDQKGGQVAVVYDEATRTFTAKTESNTITADQEQTAIEAAKTYSLWMIKEVTDRAKVAKYFDSDSSAYNTIVKSTELWMQKHSGYEFADVSVTDYARYSDSIFSVRVKLNLKVTRTDGSVKDHLYDQSMIFQKNNKDKWLCTVSTNVDLSQPVGKVRLTYMQGDTELTTGFVATDSKEIYTPKIAVPEGQVFTGWVTISKDADGATIYNLEFQPDETGVVAIPDSTILKPMTLYALIQDADEVQPVETVPAETN